MPLEDLPADLTGFAAVQSPAVYNTRAGAFAVSTDDCAEFTVSLFLGAPLCLVWRDTEGHDGYAGPAWAVALVEAALPELTRMMVADYCRAG